MDVPAIWNDFFQRWPEKLNRRGVVVTTYGEQIAFNDFLRHEHAILLERQAPDSMGGRKVVLPFHKIDCVKITDPVDSTIFKSAGFIPLAKTAPGSASRPVAT
ncbi:MAG: hypothetical protein R3E01_16275 [Pirellulaceae bacterium]|nr:hypothetical protein [Planctomycetales bacterium]